MSYRSFLLFSYDNHVDFGEAVLIPPNKILFPDTVLIYETESVNTAMIALVRKALIQADLPQHWAGISKA